MDEARSVDTDVFSDAYSSGGEEPPDEEHPLPMSGGSVCDCPCAHFDNVCCRYCL